MHTSMKCNCALLDCIATLFHFVEKCCMLLPKQSVRSTRSRSVTSTHTGLTLDEAIRTKYAEQKLEEAADKVSPQEAIRTKYAEQKSTAFWLNHKLKRSNPYEVRGAEAGAHAE